MAMLFTMFERQPHWAFAQLQQETHQPTDHLKVRGTGRGGGVIGGQGAGRACLVRALFL